MAEKAKAKTDEPKKTSKELELHEFMDKISLRNNRDRFVVEKLLSGHEKMTLSEWKKVAAQKLKKVEHKIVN